MAQRNYLISTTALSLTASGTTVGSGNTQSSTFVVARTLVRTGLTAGELLSGSQTWSIHYVVSAMATPYEMRLKVQRRNSSGVMQAESGYGTTRSVTGTYDDNLTADLGTWAANDQLALVWEHRRPSGSGNKSGTIDANGASYIDAPAVVTTNLVIANASHAHSVVTPTLTQVHQLVIQNSVHTHSASVITFPDVTTNLVAHWKFNESSGSTRNDSWGVNHATNVGTAVGTTTGIVGNAATIREDGYLSVADNVSNSLTGNFTACIAFKLIAGAANNVPSLMGKWDSSGGRSWHLRYQLDINRFLAAYSTDGTGSTGASKEHSFAPSNGVQYWGWIRKTGTLLEIRISTTSSIGSWESATGADAAMFDSSGALEFGRLATSGNVGNFDLDTGYLWNASISDAVLAQVWNGGAGFELASPIANAGQDQVRKGGELAMLDSSRSTDDIAITSRTWSQISGTPVTLSSTSAVNPTYTCPSAPATLVFEVEVENALSQTDSDRVTISVVDPSSNTWFWHTPQEAGLDAAAFHAAIDTMPLPSLVARNGRIIGTRGDVTLVGLTWSASKMQTAMIAARLIQQNSIELSDAIPGSDVPTGPTATLKQLLSMTGDYDLTPHSPDDHFAYNNAGISFLGNYLNDTFYAGQTKVEMKLSAYGTALHYEDAIGFAGTTSGWDGGWSMSTRDLGRDAQLVLDGGVRDGVQILDANFCNVGLWQEQIPEAATQSTDESNEFTNQAGTSSVMKDDWSLGWWFIHPDGIQTQPFTAIAMFGKFGTSAWVHKGKGFIAVACNVGGTTDDSVQTRILSSSLEALLDSSQNDLVVNGGSHAHSAANVVLEADVFLSVLAATHVISSQNLDITQVHALAVQNASHAHMAEDFDLPQVHQLALQASSHAHTAENLALTQLHELAVQEAAHAHAAENAVLTQVHVLGVNGAMHDHAAENITLESGGVLAIQDAAHDHTANNLTLAQLHLLAVDGATHGHVADSLALVQLHVLAVSNALHGHVGQSLDLTQAHNLALADAIHAQAADNIELVAEGSLAIQAGNHGHTVENIALTQLHLLSVNDANHGHSVESLLLTQQHSLIVNNAVHGQSAETLVLISVHSLAVQNALHAHAAQNLILLAAGDLDIASGAHGHLATNLALTQAHALIVGNSEHGHIGETLLLTQVHGLSVSAALHSLTSESLALSQEHALTVNPALHPHSATNIGFGLSLVIASGIHAHTSDVVPLVFIQAGVQIVIKPDNRTIVIPVDNRTIKV